MIKPHCRVDKDFISGRVMQGSCTDLALRELQFFHIIMLTLNLLNSLHYFVTETKKGRRHL